VRCWISLGTFIRNSQSSLLPDPAVRPLPSTGSNWQPWRSRANGWKRTISARSAEFRTQSQPVSVAAIEEAIPPGAALIEFSAYHPFDPKLRRIDAYGELHYVVYVLRRQGEVQ
jgi:hypothetical protein